MLGIETVVLVGVCIFYINFMVRDCAHGRENRARFINNTDWGILDHDVIFLPTPPTLVRKIEIDNIAPLDPTEPDGKEACSICLEELKDVKYRRKTICGHTFCSECIREWLHKKQVCPLCNTDL